MDQHQTTPLKLSLIQTSTHWHDPPANREMFTALLDEVPADTRLVLLPEMFSTGFTMASQEVAEPMSGPTVQWLLQQAQSRRQILCGSLVITEHGAYFNRFICAFPDGALQIYDKRHLFRMAGEHHYYRPGTNRVVLDIDSWRVCPMVCYDLRFPVWFRNTGDYDLLVCVANWPAARRDAWSTLLRARAIENQSYVAAVNIVGCDGNDVVYAGGSAVYGPDGATLEERFDEARIVTQILDHEHLQNLRREFPAWQDADRFSVER